MNRYTITYVRGGSEWKYHNIDAEDEEQAREIFNKMVRFTLDQASQALFKKDIMSEDDKKTEIDKIKIVTISKII